MSPQNKTKINQLLQSQPTGIVFMASWMEKNGISRDLQKRYRKSGWLESVGRGVMKRSGDQVSWLGALYSLQKQGQFKVHVGARSALEMLGKAHYLNLSENRTFLFGTTKTFLPRWFKKNEWGRQIEMIRTDFLPPYVGLTEYTDKTCTVWIANAARAMMECLYLTPEKIDILEAYELMEGLATLRPAKVQELLNASGSIKVNRLFLYLANKTGHSWVRYLNKEQVELGSGKRHLVKKGVYIPEWKITVPKALEPGQG